MDNEKFKGKYKISTNRLKNWDYSSPGLYFVTICVAEMEWLFGKVLNGIVELSTIGKTAERLWIDIANHYTGINIDTYIIMPNHIHGIINILSSETNQRKEFKINRFSHPIKKSLSVIIGQYKSAVKRWCNKNEYNHFIWQPRYYEHIIQEPNELDNIKRYIINNPKNWKDDEYYKQLKK